ncbi:hypothetical protein CQW29_02475 [Pantoea coffeiphila]|uniref:Uncharacterized protein n=1 Tax=Pantoea coffeiphila TaxID=1465635 RepID=A0A2S9II87_9GAMM|nr:hypothetical protein CQW29_02475 [Pantoea coffeiphila]
MRVIAKNAEATEQTDRCPLRQSAALNEERKPGFGRMDAAEKHSRGRTPRLCWSVRLTNGVRAPQSGARTAEAGSEPSDQAL